MQQLNVPAEAKEKLLHKINPVSYHVMLTRVAAVTLCCIGVTRYSEKTKTTCTKKQKNQTIPKM